MTTFCVAALSSAPKTPGILINIATKSGGSQFHGTAYEFLRNDALDANPFFRSLQGLKKAKLRFNQFGGDISGPIYLPHVSTRSDKRLFFSFNYEGTRASRESRKSQKRPPKVREWQRCKLYFPLGSR